MSDSAFSKKVGAFASATLISRILGYVRDSMVAAYFGGGLVTDAFYAAVKIPNLLRRFLGEGSLTAAFIPVFTDTLHNKGQDEAKKFLNALFSGLLVVLSVVILLGIIYAPLVTKIVSYGFTQDPAKFNLTVELTRLTFPFLLMVVLAALVSAVLNSCGRFFIPGVSPSGLSIVEILFILLVARHMSDPIKGLAVAAVIGVGLHFLWQLPDLNAEGYHLRLTTHIWHPEVKTVFLLMLPTVLGLCSDQVNSFVDQFCASFLRDGSITALYNSNRVMQLPLALFGIAVSSVALPALSHSSSIGNDAQFKNLLSYSLRLANFVLIPSLIGLMVLGVPIIKLLFEHGRFTHNQTLLTVSALIPYAMGLPAFSASKILASAFYAKKDTQTPVKISILAMLINAVLNVVLMTRFEVAGLAFATSFAAWVQALLLFVLLKRRLGPLQGRGIAMSFIWGLFIGGVMGLCCYLSFAYLLRSLYYPVRALLSIAIGAGAYMIMAKTLNLDEYRHFMSTLSHRRIEE